MFRKHLTYAVRYQRRHLGFSVINLVGFAVAFAGCLLIGAYVLHEYSYDQMHPEGDRLFRLTTAPYLQQSPENARTPVGLAQRIEALIPEVERATQVLVRSGSSVQSELNSQIEPRTFFADPGIFDLLELNVVQGESSTALVGPNKVVVTESTARKYFGRTDVIGNLLRINAIFSFEDYEITALLEDPPSNTHFQFDFLISSSSFPPPDRPMWHARSAVTYVRLTDSNPETLSRFRRSLADLSIRETWPELAASAGLSTPDELILAGRAYSFVPQQVSKIRTGPMLRNELTGWNSVEYLNILILIAFVILFVAILNFVNLSTAKAIQRRREVGVRKAIGAARIQLITQQLTESTLLAIFALGGGILLALLVTPIFSDIVGTDVSLFRILTPGFGSGVVFFAIAVGLCAGIYPAFVLSGFRPIQCLTGAAPTDALSPMRLRSLLVGFQFAVSLLMITGLVAVSQQTKFLLEKDLQFDPEEVLVINRTNLVDWDAADPMKDAIRSIPGVIDAAYFEGIPGQWPQGGVYGRSVTNPGDEVLFARTPAGIGFQDALGLEIVSGRGFTEEFGMDSTGAVINMAAARALGFNNAIGEVVQLELSPPAEYHIVGVVRDFHFNSLREAIRPLIIMREYPGSTPDNLMLRLDGTDIRSTIAQIETAWHDVMPGEVFSYVFLDDQVQAQYTAERKTGRLFRLATVLSVLIGLLGLLGLTSFSVRARIREIAIRVVLGANERHIYWIFARKILVMYVLALVLSAPIGWIAMRHWMDNFAYRADLSPMPFIMAIVTLAILIGAAVFHQTHASVRRNPVEVLGSE